MILRPMFEDDDDYVCELTKFLDSKIKSKYFKLSETYKRGITYVYDPVWSVDRGFSGKDEPSVILGVNKHPVPKDHAFLTLRRPGRTIGSIKINEYFRIQEIYIDEDVLCEFTLETNELDVFIGRRVRIMSDLELVFSKTAQKNHFISELTEEMDKYLLEEYPRDIFEDGYTYLDYIAFTPQTNNELVYAIRTPGATRANLVVDTNTLKVKKIVCCDDVFESEYMPELKENLNKYIGRKIKIIGGK